MKKGILFVGLEVDDNMYHACLRSKHRGTEGEFACKPDISAVCSKLKRFKEQGFELRICYEATYIGFSLKRQLNERGYHCDIIAPSLTPREPGKKVKTDKIDCRKLARYYLNGLLTIIHVPNEQEEAVRDLIRVRGYFVNQVKRMKARILSLCRRMGMNYKNDLGRSNASYWTVPFYLWLDSQISKHSLEVLKVNLRILLTSLKQLEGHIELYNEQIKKYAETKKYKRSVESLCCYRGVDTLTAMTLTTEIGDVNRFDHPRRMVSFAGMEITERSSGKGEKKFSITHMGNRYLRTAVVESCQVVNQPVRISRALEKRRMGVDPRLVGIADRCMNRLNKRALHLMYKGKQINKVKVACAREMLGFVWESLKTAAA